MSAFYHSHLRTATSIIEIYDCGLPFAQFLKTFFKRNKKFGSRDRKHIADLCFGFLRLGQSAREYAIEDQIVIGFFLTHVLDDGCLQVFKPEWLPFVKNSLTEKLQTVKADFPLFNEADIFSFGTHLSTNCNTPDFSSSHLIQPDFFLRLRPGKKARVLKSLELSGINYTLIQENIVKVSSGANLQEVIELDKDCVVQDLASQRCGELLDLIPEAPFSIWDACAGSGGKSILLMDKFPEARLFVSDIRQDILEELSSRFKNADVAPSAMFCNDLTSSMSSQVTLSHLPAKGADLIVADVPCTGSGTWRRSPEWLRCFETDMIHDYSERQFKIVCNLAGHLRPGGHLLYVTCSVFKEENEQMVDKIQDETRLSLVESKLISAAAEGGDTMFAALFTL